MASPLNRTVAVSLPQSEAVSDDPCGSVLESMRDDPEASLVFRLARSSFEASPGVQRVTDWPRLLQLASDENALIALLGWLRHVAPFDVPADVERHLVILALDRSFRMRRLQERLGEAIHALNSIGIEPLLLKGAALAYTVYGSFAERPMRDIDLLVRVDRVNDARAIMLELGWVLDAELPGDKSYSAHHHLPPLRDVSGQRLEIHRALLPEGHPFLFKEDEIWSASLPIRVGSGHARVMHPSHHAAHIAIHFAWAHMLNLGGWHAFRDLSTLNASGTLDWDDFARTGRRWRASSCVYWTLRLGRIVSGLAVPAGFLKQLRPVMPEFVRRLLTRHFIRGLAGGDRRCPSARLTRALWTLAVQPQWSGHRAVRPWRVSLALMSALEERAERSASSPRQSRFAQMRRWGSYISEIVA